MNLLRILLLLPGLVFKLISLCLDGSRDLANKIRFSKSIIDSNCFINPNTEIKSNCHILEGVILLNSTVDSFTYIGKKSVIQNAAIGSFCSIASEVCIGLGKHPVEHFSTSTVFYKTQNTLNIKLVDTDLPFKEYEPVNIGSDVWIGARSIILDGVTIGHGAVIAANSVVSKDVAPYSIVGGVPAKIIRYRFSPEKIQSLLDQEWWKWELSKIKSTMSELNNV